MPTVSYGISVTADDVTEIPGVGIDPTLLAQGELTGLGLPGYTGAVGFRFLTNSSGPPQGSTIDSATLTLKSTGGDGSAWGVIKGVLANNAPAWTITGPVSAAKTTASVTITSGATVAYDVKALVQAIVNQSGYAAGNAIAFACDPTGANGGIAWVDRQDSSTDCAQLSITYSTGGGASYSIAGSASGAGTAAGAVLRAAPMAAASSGVGTAAAQIGRATPVSATASASGAASGAASLARSIDGSASATGSVSGDVAALRPMSADANGAGTTTGEIEREAGSYTIEGVAAVVVTYTASIGRETPLAADAAGSATAALDAYTLRPIGASSSGVAAAVGDTGFGSPISASANASGAASGAVLRLATIDGVAVGTGTATGAMNRTTALSADAQSVGYASGDMATDDAAAEGGQVMWRRRRGSAVR